MNYLYAKPHLSLSADQEPVFKRATRSCKVVERQFKNRKIMCKGITQICTVFAGDEDEKISFFFLHMRIKTHTRKCIKFLHLLDGPVLGPCYCHGFEKDEVAA